MVVDGRGKWITPGFIDTHAHHATDAHNDATVSVTSMGRIKDVIDPTDIDVYRVLAGGNTTSNLLHGSVNPIGGQSAVVKWRWGRPAKEMLFEGAPREHEVRDGRQPQVARHGPRRRRRAALPGQPHGRGGRHPHGLPGGARLPRRAGSNTRS